MIWRAIDLETWLIAPGYLAPHPVSLAWADVQTPEAVTLRLWSDPRVLAEVGEVLQGGVVGHNVAYDLGVLVQWYPALRGAVWQAYADGRVLDTRLACQLADVAAADVQKTYTLADCCSRVLGVSLEGKHGPDAWRLRYRELTDTPIAQWAAAADQYARLDVTYTAHLWNKIGRQPTDDFEARAAWALHLSAAWGMRVHPDAVATVGAELDATLVQRDATLRRHGVLRGNGSKEMGLVERLVAADLGADAPKTATGRCKTDADTLDACAHPALVALREAGTAAKLRSSFLPYLRKAGMGSLHPTYHVVKKSDRVSCGNPNLQQLPRKGGIREVFRTLPGNVFVSGDYAGAELVCLAEVLLAMFDRSSMADAIRAGQDLHLNTASMLLHREYADVTAAYKGGDAKVADMRQLSKALNFGIPGGMAPASLRGYLAGYGVTVTLTEATHYRNRWLETYPEMDKYFKLIKSGTRSGECKITHPLTGFVRGGVYYTSGCNHYFQSLLAKVAKEALWRVSLECYGALGSNTALRGARISAFVHDEILLEVRREDAPAAAERLAVVMQAAAVRWLPLLGAHLKVDPCAMSRWSKSAKTVRDANGRLLIWDPPTAQG